MGFIAPFACVYCLPTNTADGHPFEFFSVTWLRLVSRKHRKVPENVSCSDTDRQPAYSRMANSRRRDGVLSQSSILGQNLENGQRIINNLQTPKPIKNKLSTELGQLGAPRRRAAYWQPRRPIEGLSRIGAAKFGSIDQETLLNWTYRFNKESLEGLINPKTEEKAE